MAPERLVYAPPMAPPLHLRLAGQPSDTLAAALAAAGAVVGSDTPDLLVVSGTAFDLPDTAPAPIVLVCADPGPAELALLESDVILELLRPDTPPVELAVRLRRARAHAATPRSDLFVREVDRLLALVRDLATSADLPALLGSVVHRLADAAGFERCSLVLFDASERPPTRGRVVAASDRSGPLEIAISLADYPEIREALRTGEPVVVTDTTRDPLVGPIRARLESLGVGAVAVFPLDSGGDIPGALVLRASRPFARREALALGKTVALAAALAVRHATLVDAARATAARELQESAELLEHLSDGVAVIDREGQLILLNPAGERILRIRADAAVGRPLLEVATPAEPLAGQLLLRELVRGGRVLNADLDVALDDGTRLVLSISAGQLRRDDRAILSFRDVTERRGVELELRRTRDFLERLIDASSDAIIAADLRGRLVVFNRAAEKLYGLTAAEARSQLTVRDLYPQGGAQEVMRLLRESPTSQIEAVRGYGRTKSGDLVPIELSAAIVQIDGTETATVGLLRDLRERVRVEQELARTRARLTEAEKQSTITALAGATAHELNQPLTVVLGWVELLRRRADDTSRKPLEAIAVEAERMSQIVKRIAKLTRLEMTNYVGEKQIADLERSSEPKPGPPIVRR